MSRITRAEAELDAKLERAERERKNAELRAQGIEPPKPTDTEPKTLLGWIVTIIGFLLLISLCIGFNVFLAYFLP